MSVFIYIFRCYPWTRVLVQQIGYLHCTSVFWVQSLASIPYESLNILGVFFKCKSKNKHWISLSVPKNKVLSPPFNSSLLINNRPWFSYFFTGPENYYVLKLGFQSLKDVSCIIKRISFYFLTSYWLVSQYIIPWRNYLNLETESPYL